MIQKNRAPKKTMHKRGVQRFSVDNFSLTVPKNFVGKRFCVSELFWFQNFLDNRVITFLSIVFVAQCRKICGEPSNDSKDLGHPKKL